MRKLLGARVVVVGMARSGVAAIRLLRQHGAVVRAVDEKPTGEMEGVTAEPQTDAAFRDAELVVISPGVPADLDLLASARARGVPCASPFERLPPSPNDHRTRGESMPVSFTRWWRGGSWHLEAP